MADNGMRSLKRRLARIPASVKAAVRPALNQAADEMVRSARVMVPKGDTKALSQSIRKEDGRDELQILVKAGGPTTTKPVRSGASATYDYAAAMEFGTRKVAAQPYFWPAYRLNKKRMSSRIRRAITKAVKEGFENGS